MKRLHTKPRTHCTKPISLLFAALLVLSLLPAQQTAADGLWPAAPDVHAPAAIVMEADTGAVLYEKDIHTQYYPASITKLMTTMLALEHCSLDEVVTFSYDSVHKIEGTHIGIDEGEQLTMEQCLYAIMLGSANEVSYAVAEHVGGTVDNFVAMMNEKAAALGCTETHFANPHGLPNDAHVTSAHDMALIAQAAYTNATFRTITKTVSYTIPATNKTAETRPISNHHQMLKRGPYKYESCTGGKTGYTNAARNTLVTYAEQNGLTLICVVMHDDTAPDHYTDSIALLDYGFQNFKKLAVTESDLGLQLSSDGFFPIEHTPLTENAGKIKLGSSAQLVIPNQGFLSNVASSIHFTSNTSGEIAQLSCTLDGHFVGKLAITYTPGKNSKPAATQPSSTEKTQKQKTTEKKAVTIPLRTILLLLFVIVCVIGFIIVVLYLVRNGIF